MQIDFLKILRALTAAEVEFVIVGGVAARLHGGTRLTQDVDIVPSLESESWARAIDVIWDNGGRPRIPETKDSIRDIGNVQQWIHDKGMLALSFRSADGLVEVDLLVSESPRLSGLMQRAVAVELEGLTYRVASIDDLIQMKRIAGRARDLLDVAELEEIKSHLSPRP